MTGWSSGCTGEVRNDTTAKSIPKKAQPTCSMSDLPERTTISLSAFCRCGYDQDPQAPLERPIGLCRRLVMRTHERSPSSIGRLERFTDGPKVLGMLRQRVVHAGTGRRGTPNNAHNRARTAVALARRHGGRVFLGAGPTVAD